MGSPIFELRTQWSNPSDIFSLLLIIGADIVQKALAQLAGDRFVPVCFSFGWVAYSFNTVMGLNGEGRLMPPPDCPCKVMNLGNGYSRENRSWVIGRLLLDEEERSHSRPLLEDFDGRRIALRVVVYDWADDPGLFDRRKFWSTAIMLLQFVCAAIPLALYQDWLCFLITAAGTFLALLTGSLHQWRAEKKACKRGVRKDIAITKGNGSGLVVIIRTGDKGLDLEDLASVYTPRSGRMWENQGWFTKALTDVHGKQIHDKWGTGLRQALFAGGIPRDFWVTRTTCMLLCCAWIALLITATSVNENAWFLMLVGGLGMAQNAYLAASSCDPALRDIPLDHVESFADTKVMRVLQDLESRFPSYGSTLLTEFFPGKLTEEEEKTWEELRGHTKEGRAEVESESLSLPVARSDTT